MRLCSRGGHRQQGLPDPWLWLSHAARTVYNLKWFIWGGTLDRGGAHRWRGAPMMLGSWRWVWSGTGVPASQNCRPGSSSPSFELWGPRHAQAPGWSVLGRRPLPCPGPQRGRGSFLWGPRGGREGCRAPSKLLLQLSLQRGHLEKEEGSAARASPGPQPDFREEGVTAAGPPAGTSAACFRQTQVS